jgi:single-strand DNA-binding protein
MNLNKVFLIGRLTQDPITKNLPSGKLVCNFGLATDRYFVDKSGQKQQKTDFHNIVLFGRLAEIASQYLKKGSLVFIEGRIRTRNWQDKNGNKKFKTEIVAERIQLGPKAAGKVIPPEAPEEIPIVEDEEIDIDEIPF